MADATDPFQRCTVPLRRRRRNVRARPRRFCSAKSFRILPEIQSTPAKQGQEFENALNASRQGALFTHLTAPPDPANALDFPVDTWLYGVARVREKMQAWEQTVMLRRRLGGRSRSSTRCSFRLFPATTGWAGVCAGPKARQERLLYTAHFASAVQQGGAPVRPVARRVDRDDSDRRVDTGIAFHYDRPNCEAPQAMLLVTPAQFRGAWQWDDLIDALNETLDLAKRRAVEPKHIDATPYAPFLPATIMASQAAATDHRRRSRAQQRDGPGNEDALTMDSKLHHHESRGGSRDKSRAGHHLLEPSGGTAARRQVRARAARRGARRAVDADAAVADGRVPRRRCGLADLREGAVCETTRLRKYQAVNGPVKRSTKRSRSKRESSSCRCPLVLAQR